MSAKLLMGLSEENPELERQIGCMTGFFQVFDRRHMIMGRRLSGNSHKRLPPSGQLRSGIGSTYSEERSPSSPQIVLEYNLNKISKENRRVSVESSASLSSSPSYSSLKGSNIETKQSHNDFRDVVKDCINGEKSRALSVKTSVKDDMKKDNVLKHRDSPRPVMSVDFSDSLKVFVRLKEASSTISEVSRFSCDGREFTRSKSSTKLRELPRLSLDSRSNLNQGSPSVVAKLMGLEALPSSTPDKTQLVNFCTKKTSDPLCGDIEKDRIMNSLKNASPVSKYTSKQPESVYSQIERRAKELEFPQSNKDLRALKHVLDTMQSKGILETKKIEPITTPRAFESPIVIMKPAKTNKRSGDLEGLSGLRKLKTNNSAIQRKARDQAPQGSIKKGTEESSSQRNRIPQMQRSPRPQQLIRDKSASPVKNTGSSSPRVQQRKLEPEKKPRPAARKLNANRNGKLKVKQSEVHDHRSNQANEISQREDGNIRLASPADAEVMGEKHQLILDCPSHQQDNEKVLSEDSSSTDSAIVLVDHPSPISVLDATFYQDDLLLSPVKKISCAIEDDEIQASSEDCKIVMNLADTTPSKLSSEIHLQKLFGIKNLVGKLSHLSSSDIADIQESDDDHLSQILLSAGLLSDEKTPYLQSNSERINQELMFDAVKEILVHKLELMRHGPQHNLFLRSKKVSRQNLWEELYSEIKQLLVQKPRVATVEDEDLTFRDDLLRKSEGWEDFGMEVPGLVLEIERMIFKDLIDEVVTVEAQSKASRRRKQLFA